MAIILHIIIALVGIVYASYIFISPSKNKLYGSYFLTALTLGSGSYLVFKNPAHMAQACITGVIYLGFVVLATISARHKLASDRTKV